MRPRLWLLTPVLAIFSISAFAATPASFQSAKPIWPSGLTRERNLFVGFRAVVEGPKERSAVLRLTASTVYRAFVNGEFLGYGPARAAHGYFRVDEWPLGTRLRPGKNVIAIEVAGYNVNSYYVLDQPSFLQAEVVADGKVLASTSGGGAAFEAILLPERVKRVPRYSFQRPFSEVYRLDSEFELWRKNSEAHFTKSECEILPAPKVLARSVAYPEFRLRAPLQEVGRGTLKYEENPGKIRKDYFITHIGPQLQGFKEDELESFPYADLQKFKSIPIKDGERPFGQNEKVRLTQNSYRVFDLGTNLTGFLGVRIRSLRRTQLFLTFDEIPTSLKVTRRGGYPAEGDVTPTDYADVDFKRLSCVNVVAYDLPQGEFSLESFEPYTLRYLKLIVLEGEGEIDDIHLREYANPEVDHATFTSSDKRLNRLFEAGRETFRQNSVDIFMDCPSRERAGWLCDSFFTARSAANLSGNAKVERNFLENFLLPDHFDDIPRGMLPMCYPADHPNGNFIPNWALWFVLQLEEYQMRSGDRQLVDALRPRVLALFDYFKPFRNQDGLLEKLKGWVFVEWSIAGDFVQDVNYPTNMLYAAALASAGRMYNMPALTQEAEQIRAVIRRQAFDGDFFLDHALRHADGLDLAPDRTEVCQYFAFLFDVATPESHPKLWRTITDTFGPEREQTKALADIYPANAFVGNVLRLEILSRYGRAAQAVKESADFFYPMAVATGTLWENMDTSASCNHGFASHIVRVLFRDALGLYAVNPSDSTLVIRFAASDLAWCAGRMPTPHGPVALRWERKGDEIRYHLESPSAYKVKIENLSGKRLKKY
jgi:alpha-L-rhamnosidase